MKTTYNDGIAKEFQAIKRKIAGIRYLLITSIQWYVDEDGAVWLDHLWARDLAKHAEYLPSVTVLGPRAKLPQNRPKEIVKLLLHDGGLHFIDVPLGDSLTQALRHLPKQAQVIYKAIKQADVVHSSVAGWPLPLGFIANPLAIFMGKPLVMVVESAFWRVHVTGDRTFKSYLRQFITEAIAKWSCGKSRLCVFTHKSYALELGYAKGERMLVEAASWIDQGDLIDVAAIDTSWQQRPKIPSFLVASRMNEAKGMETVISAIEKAEEQRFRMNIDFIGEGPLLSRIVSLSTGLKAVQVRVLEPVVYGIDFFEIIRRYHAVIVPTLSDEQPRIIYDAFSQAVPAIVSDTAGHAEAVASGETGVLYEKGNPAALLNALQSCDPGDLQRMGRQAFSWVGQRTHSAMHLSRARALLEIVAEMSGVDSAHMSH